MFLEITLAFLKEMVKLQRLKLGLWMALSLEKVPLIGFLPFVMVFIRQRRTESYLQIIAFGRPILIGRLY
jgi:hypothetical protein